MSESVRQLLMASIPSYFLGIACLLVPALGNAQPGATPPGSVPPYAPAPSDPAPNPGPPPSPDYGPDYGPNYGPNYGPRQPPLPPPNQERGRSGWNIGFSGTIGSMSSSAGELACEGCEVSPPAIGGELHIGTMVMPRLALQGEFWIVTRDLDAYGEASLNQQLFLLTAQYWLTPRFWIKAGLGLASLSLTYFDGYEDVNEGLESGTALMAALGYEIIQSGKFAIDLQLKTGRGLYTERDEEVSTNVIALGFHWY